MEINQANIHQFFGFEEQQILRNSLTILQHENHLEKMFIWGRVFTYAEDYVIACGYKYDVIKSLKFFYAKLDTLDWGLLPHVNAQKSLLAIECTDEFSGMPARKISRNTCLLEDVIKGIKQYRLSEEDRLACTVDMITNDCFLVPKGSILRHYDNTITENAGFVGLLQNEINCLSSYQHYRIPQIVNCCDDYFPKKHNYVHSIDCFDFIDSDPEESWSLQICNKLEQVHIQSLDWPGYNFFYDNKTKRYDSIYVGFGLKNQFNFFD